MRHSARPFSLALAHGQHLCMDHRCPRPPPLAPGLLAPPDLRPRPDLAPIPQAPFCLAPDRRRGREVLAWSSPTCPEFVQHPCDERVRAVPHRLERLVEGGSDLLRALAQDEMPQN
jgi:hypothetical protein